MSEQKATFLMQLPCIVKITQKVALPSCGGVGQGRHDLSRTIIVLHTSLTSRSDAICNLTSLFQILPGKTCVKMGHHCCVPRCNSNSRYTGTVGLTFHAFPIDPKERKLWILSVRRADYSKLTVNKHTKVCSKHFRNEDFIQGQNSKRRMLKKGVVPSVFAWTNDGNTSQSDKKNQLPQKPDDLDIARSQKALEEAFISLEKAAKIMGLIVNESKTKYMISSRKGSIISKAPTYLTIENYKFEYEPDIITVLKIGRLQWAGHLVRMDDTRPAKRAFTSNPGGSRSVGRPMSRWENNVYEDANFIGARMWTVKCNLTPHYTTQTYPYRKQNKRRQDQQQPVLMMANSRPKHVNKLYGLLRATFSCGVKEYKLLV
ncbi:hypothetical protein ANN_24414 [Periplaneta americana]|uniref:THAP-type domain-containing protein n=1 Tax=Periplaneta americana TaxID=6978 RepID=A0ABQ8S308_PERAM|nr:hypothetical protein ANN_24414 [Periplaneta americana]